MTNTFKAINSSDQQKQIKSIASRGKKLKDDAIKLANGFLLHYVEHGDMTNAMPIADTLGIVYTKGVRKAFIDWCQEFTTTLRYDEESKQLVHQKNKSGKRELKTNEAGQHHYEVPFFDLVVEVTRPVDFKASVLSLIKRGESGIQNNNAKDYSQEDVNQLISLALKAGWLETEEVEGVIQETKSVEAA